MFDGTIWFLIIGLTIVHGSNWVWQCEDGYCKRESGQTERDGYSALKLCQLVCSNYLNIWPYPTGAVKSSKELVNINTKSIIFHYNGPTETVAYLTEITKYFEGHLKKDEPFSCEENLYNLKITFTPLCKEITSNLETNESYTLTLDSIGNEVNVNIIAPTVFGVRHGLETLSQILVSHNDDGSKCLSTLSNVQITDQPKYPHRGLLIDTARNYLSVDTIKKQIDGMAASKLNVLHWHLTDSQSFPFVSVRLPNMTKYGAYSSKKIYTPENIKDLIQYAEYRGIRIIIEIDGPSHAGMGWQWGPEAGLGDLAVCINKQPWRSFCVQPPCGQLNPVNEKLYIILRNLYSDITDISPDRRMFHMGGDEVFIPCWNSTPEILKHLRGKPLNEKTYLDLWAGYQRKNLDAYDTAIGHKNTSIVVWTSHLTQPEFIKNYLPNDRYIIQTWVPESDNDLITDLIKLGYKLIVSTKDRWYLDHGFWGTTNYYKWKTVYENPIYEKYTKAILGGEVCMWGELVDDSNIDSRIWPRAAAAAERMWSDPVTTADYAQTRFFAHRERLIERKISAEAVVPQWCAENEGECHSYL
ncbi:unnamed protein product [Psylliodes chrysocephalus]|uniref:Beta-hexosaminidase n=1 Tax=Psylliodes chrysocephalus TaxID=3402493 RepID=A0A9P0CNC5_9CUCU|nr:unnamed protein product [Psylliodes chrysocephala]